MTTWKDGGDYDRYREIIGEDEDYVICRVRTKQYRLLSTGRASLDIEPYPQGEKNFHLILQAPQMLEALEAIAEGAIVSSDQPPEKMAEAVLRVLQLVREQNLEYLLLISAQQQRAEQAEEALEAIVEYNPVYWCGEGEDEEVCEHCKSIARDAIAAVKGEDDDNIG